MSLKHLKGFWLFEALISSAYLFNSAEVHWQSTNETRKATDLYQIMICPRILNA